MTKKNSLEVDFKFFSAKFIEDILWINFQKNLFIQATDLASREALLSYLDRVSACEAIKVMVFHSSLEASGHQEYLHFFETVNSRQGNLNVHRLFNFYACLVLKLSAMNQIVIHATSGNVIPLFLNTSLACDYRIAADNTVFENAYLDVGVLPIGGGAYLLSRLIGEGKTLELLALRKAYTASEAFEYGIIDKIVPLGDMGSQTIEFARQFNDVAGSTLRGLKRLIRFSSRDLKEYLEFEDREFFRIIHHQSLRGVC